MPIIVVLYQYIELVTGIKSVPLTLAMDFNGYQLLMPYLSAMLPFSLCYIA